jgi:hypothetical protein
LKERDEFQVKNALEASRKATLPPTPEDYKIELPADFKAPAGVEFKIDTADPAIDQLKQVAHKHGLTNAAANELFGIYAAREIARETKINNGRKEQQDLLGANAGPRVDNVLNYFKGMDSTPDKRHAAALADSLSMAAHVEAWEYLMNRLATQGAASFSQQHRVTPDNKPTDEEFNKWSYGDQRIYTTTGKRPQRAA